MSLSLHFCSTATFFGRKYRVKAAEKLVSELKCLNSAYNITEFSLQHDLFTVNRRKVLEFLRRSQALQFRRGRARLVSTVLIQNYFGRCRGRMPWHLLWRRDRLFEPSGTGEEETGYQPTCPDADGCERAGNRV